MGLDCDLFEHGQLFKKKIAWILITFLEIFLRSCYPVCESSISLEQVWGYIRTVVSLNNLKIMWGLNIQIFNCKIDTNYTKQ